MATPSRHTLPALGHPQQTVNDQICAARVARNYRSSGNLAVLADKCKHLTTIHGAPEACWPAQTTATPSPRMPPLWDGLSVQCSMISRPLVWQIRRHRRISQFSRTSVHSSSRSTPRRRRAGLRWSSAWSPPGAARPDALRWPWQARGWFGGVAMGVDTADAVSSFQGAWMASRQNGAPLNSGF